MAFGIDPAVPEEINEDKPNATDTDRMEDCSKMNLISRIDLFLSEAKKEKKLGQPKELTRAEKRNRKFKDSGDMGIEKDGGKRKRRTAYSSGRRELAFDTKIKGFINLRSDIKKAVGIQQKDTLKRSISASPLGSNHRWRTR